MPRPRDLHHLTLDTGDSAMIPRSHVRPYTRAALDPVLRDLAENGEAGVPGMADWRCVAMGGGASRRCASVLVEFGSGLDRLGAAWLGIATQSRCAARLWERMHREPAGAVATDPARPPRTPWLATRMLAGAAVAGDLRWLADYSECLAWCWIDELANKAGKKGIR